MYSAQQLHSMPSINQQLAKWVTELQCNSLPPEVVTQTKFRILDIVGAMLGGLNTELVTQVGKATFVPDNGVGAKAIGFSQQTGAPAAAVLMGTMGCVLEYDDSHISTGIHASTPIVATALAKGQQLAVSGQRLIEAVLVGNEITCRLGIAAPGVFHRVGFHPTAVLSVFGAGYTATKLAQCSVMDIANTIGICGSFASGIMASWQDGTSAKSLHAGWAGASALQAMNMATQGVTGPDEVFEGRFGFYKSHVQDPHFVVQLDAITKGLGNHWEVLNVVPRAYPCGHYIQPFIAAALGLREQQAVVIEDIVEIQCLVPEYWIPLICEPRDEKIRPATSWHARYSVQFCVAESLLANAFDKRSLSQSNLTDERFLSLAQKVTYAVDPLATDRSRWSGEVVVTFKSGLTRRHRVDDLIGTPRHPMSETQLIDKFIHNADGVLPMHVSQQFIEQVIHLEKITDINTIFAPLCQGWKK